MTARLLTAIGVLAACHYCAAFAQDDKGAAKPAEEAGKQAVDTQKAKTLYAEGLALQKQGKNDEAIKKYYLAIEADPEHAPVLNHLSWLRAAHPDAKLRDGAEAVKLAEKACKVAADPAKPTSFGADCLDTLAVAYAEAGRFDDAIAAAKRAIAMAEAVNNKAALRGFNERLKMFENKQAYHDK